MAWPRLERITNIRKERSYLKTTSQCEQLTEGKEQGNSFSANIEIPIVNDDEYEKSEDFYIQLGEPIWHREMSSDVWFMLFRDEEDIF